MTVPFDKSVRVPEDVLITEVDGEAVILNLKTESYFGLDKIGARMWAAVTSSDTIQSGYESLAAEFDVDPNELREHLTEILDHLLEHGLLELRA